MRIRSTFFISLLVILAFTICPVFGQTYSQAQIREDLAYLYETLELTHYNLFVTTPKIAFDDEYERIFESLPDSLPLLEVYRRFQPFVALANLGHCTLDYPFNRLYGTYYEQEGTLFPLNVFIENGDVFIKSNFTDNSEIVRGAELVSINGRPVRDILDMMYRYLSGESDYLKNTIVDSMTLPRLMWILEETPEYYEVSIKGADGIIKEYTVDAITAKEFESRLGTLEKQTFQDGRSFTFIDGIAYIRPGTFMNADASGNTSETITFDKGEFVSFIDSAFTEIHNRKSENLIIDLRNNSGGSNTFSDEMLAYFSDTPFRFCSTFSVKTSEVTKDYWKQVDDPSLTDLKNQILSHSNGEIFEVDLPNHEPREDSLTFAGTVYVLINRYTYSQATITAAMVQDYEFGTLIGETTADIPTTYGSIHQFSLPNTEIAVSYPKAFIVRPNGDTVFEGTIPDYSVDDDVLSEEDEILEYALELIARK